MRNIVLALLCGAFSLSAAQAQTGRQIRTVETFQAVHAGGGIDVVITQGPVAAVTVEAGAAAQQYLRTTVQRGTLQIGWDPDRPRTLHTLGHATVYVTCPRLTELSVSGGSDARSETPITADAFSLSASGGSDVRLSLKAGTLTASASGGGDIYLTGQADRQRVDVSGGSDYHAFALQSTTATVGASGGSDIEVSVSGELSADTSGGSGVRYKGDARVVKSHASGGSSLHQVR